MKYKNYIFDLYGTLIDIHTDENEMMLWEFMVEYLKEHFGTITIPEKLKDDYIRICAEETDKLAAKNQLADIFIFFQTHSVFSLKRNWIPTWLLATMIILI